MLRRGMFRRICEAYEQVTGRPVVANDLRAGVSLLDRAALDERHIEDPLAALTIAAAAHAILGRQVHLLTPTHELARRRAVAMRPVAALLDLRVGLLGPDDERDRRTACYQSDIVCAHVEEVAHDVLRDCLAWSPEEKVQANRSAAVIDHVDTVLIDRAEMQPYIAGLGTADEAWLKCAREIAAPLACDRDFVLFEGTASLTPEGVEAVLPMIDLPSVLEEHVAVFEMVEAALAARTCHRGADYEIVDGEVVTGSPRSPAVRAAIAVAEGLPPFDITKVLGMTSVRRHVLGYKYVSGIGVLTELAGRQLRELYRLRVRPGSDDLPTRDDLLFEDEPSRMRAVLDAIRDARGEGQSVLVAAASADLVTAAEAAGIPGTAGFAVLGPADPVPDERYGTLVGLGRHETRRRDIRLVATAEHAQFYLTTAELESVGGEQAQRTLSVAKQQDHIESVSFYHYGNEFLRNVADVRDHHRTQLDETCDTLLAGDDMVETFRRLLHDYLDELVRWHRKGQLSYQELLDELKKLYPCRLSWDPPKKLSLEVHADAERALTARRMKFEDTLGYSIERLIRQIILRVRDACWCGHIIDLGTLATAARKVHPRRRIGEFQRQADEQFTALLSELFEGIIKYAFFVSIEELPELSDVVTPAPRSRS